MVGASQAMGLNAMNFFAINSVAISGAQGRRKPYKTDVGKKIRIENDRIEIELNFDKIQPVSSKTSVATDIQLLYCFTAYVCMYTALITHQYVVQMGWKSFICTNRRCGKHRIDFILCCLIFSLSE